MLHVGAVVVVPAHLGELFGRQHVSDLRETDQAQVVLRELARDEGVQRHRHLLGRQEVVAHGHREREVEHEDRG